ncbi:MAG: hypothetical protein MAG431_01562 [Chloroflexi bacterium]|nr:hypothetical protein [Chloroflexota bacterium]
MTLLLIAFLFAALEWLAEHKKNQRGIYLTKPTMMVSLIAWVLVSGDLLAEGSVFPRLWFVIGLVFCLGGDVFLMLPERFFLPGLVSFLLGHVFYILAFGPLLPPQGSFWPGLAVVGFLLVLGVIIYRKLDRGMTASGNERMRIPVLAYSVVISLMLYAALTRGLGGRWNTTSAIWVGVGAALFYLSDILNAWRRFVGDFSNARLVIMMTYHLGQIGLALGVVLR